MTSTERLAKDYEIITRWENGKAYFSSNFRSVVMTSKYKDVSKLMEDIETNEKPSMYQPVVVEIKKCLLVLYPDEILHLLIKDDDLFEKACRRGNTELQMRNVEKGSSGKENNNAL